MQKFAVFILLLASDRVCCYKTTITVTRTRYRLAETSTVEAEVEAVPVDGVSMVTSDVTLSRGLMSLPSRDSGPSTCHIHTF